MAMILQILFLMTADLQMFANLLTNILNLVFQW